jgi:4-hydroxybenzoate polyprenyltransferase
MFKDIIKLLRPSQWIKNGVVLAGLIFSGKAQATGQVEMSLLALVAFCFLSSSVYVLNDLIDRERDRAHPLKKSRPIASGRIQTPTATGLFLILGLVMVISYLINSQLLLLRLLLLWFCIPLLKNIVAMGVMTIAGFVRRWPERSPSTSEFSQA